MSLKCCSYHTQEALAEHFSFERRIMIELKVLCESSFYLAQGDLP